MYRRLSAVAVLGAFLAACANGAQQETETAAVEPDLDPAYLDTSGIERAMIDTTAYGVTEEGEVVWGIYFDPNGTARALARDGDGFDRDSGNWDAQDNALCFSDWHGWEFMNECFRVQLDGNVTIWEAMGSDFVNQAMLVEGNPDEL